MLCGAVGTKLCYSKRTVKYITGPFESETSLIRSDRLFVGKSVGLLSEVSKRAGIYTFMLQLKHFFGSTTRKNSLTNNNFNFILKDFISKYSDRSM